jgi:hypothetical protein
MKFYENLFIAENRKPYGGQSIEKGCPEKMRVGR